MSEALATRSRNHLFGVGVDPKAASLIGNQKLKEAREAGKFTDISRLKKLTSGEWDDNYTAKSFPGIWGRHFNSTYRDYTRHYGLIAGTSPQYRTLCWRAAALGTTIAMVEAHVIDDPLALRLRYNHELIETIAQLQKYTESEKRESVVIDATKEKVLSVMIAVADHVLSDTEKPILFAALRRVIAGGDLDAARAVSLLAQAEPPRGNYLDSTSRRMPDGDRVDVLSAIDESTPESSPDNNP